MTDKNVELDPDVLYELAIQGINHPDDPAAGLSREHVRAVIFQYKTVTCELANALEKVAPTEAQLLAQANTIRIRDEKAARKKKYFTRVAHALKYTQTPCVLTGYIERSSYGAAEDRLPYVSGFNTLLDNLPTSTEVEISIKVLTLPHQRNNEDDW